MDQVKTVRYILTNSLVAAPQFDLRYNGLTELSELAFCMSRLNKNL